MKDLSDEKLAMLNKVFHKLSKGKCCYWIRKGDNFKEALVQERVFYVSFRGVPGIRYL
ncbi:hypothetical protein D3C74_224670 [compost metagenome]